MNTESGVQTDTWADLEIVVDPGNRVPSNKTRLAETFKLISHNFVVNMDICHGLRFLL